MAGPSFWKLLLPGPLNLPSGPATLRPFSSKTTRSGVKGLVDEVGPPTVALLLLLQSVASLKPEGSPLPDSMTKTLKRLPLPWNAMPVGKFRSLAKTETLNPSGTAMSWPEPGSKKTVSVGQLGLLRV